MRIVRRRRNENEMNMKRVLRMIPVLILAVVIFPGCGAGPADSGRAEKSIHETDLERHAAALALTADPRILYPPAAFRIPVLSRLGLSPVDIHARPTKVRCAADCLTRLERLRYVEFDE